MPGMPDGIKKHDSLPDVDILSSEVYAVGITFGSPRISLEAAQYVLLDLHACCCSYGLPTKRRLTLCQLFLFFFFPLQVNYIIFFLTLGLFVCLELHTK